MTKTRPNVKAYLLVFAALAALTLLTVGVSYLRLPVVAGVAAALAIAAVKAGLVAAFFMHLKNERPIIYGVLAVTIGFVVLLYVLPISDSVAIADRATHTQVGTPPSVDPNVP